MKRGFSGVVNIGDEVQQLARAMEKNDPDIAASARVQLAWRNAVDEKTLQHTVAVFAVPGSAAAEVLVYVDSSIRAADMNMQSERFRMHLNIALAELREQEDGEFLAADDDALFTMRENVEVVKKIKFIVSKKAYAPQKRRQSTAELLAAEDEAARPRKVDVSDATREELCRAAADIDDERLRRVVLEAAQSNLSRADDGAGDTPASSSGGEITRGNEKAPERFSTQI